MRSSAHLSRRHFLRNAGACSLMGSTLAPLALNFAAAGGARAAGAGDYKALVCLFMFGGNDAYNTVLATDDASWSAYSAARATDTNDPLALQTPGTPADRSSPLLHRRIGGALPITPIRNQGRSFALHPMLAPLQSMFSNGSLAIVPNVGPLVKPMTKADYLSSAVPLPPKLFSHNDQQSVWQSLQAEGSITGWGGQLVDPFAADNDNPLFSSISLSGSQVWASGDYVRMYQLAPTGVVRIGVPEGLFFNSTLMQQKMLSVMRGARSTSLLQQDHAAVSNRAIECEGVLAAAMPAAGAGPWGTAGVPAGGNDPLLMYRQPDTGLLLPNPVALRLQAVARMISARGNLNMSRQTFFVGIDGFDTHDTQNTRHADGMAQLAHAMQYFDTVLRAMGVSDAVTTFTASDFGRTFAVNGDGTDHGWGGHHFVMGSAVRGGDLYGRFPTYGVTDGMGGYTSNDQLRGGALLPSQSVEQYAATLGRWFGLSDTELLTAMPSLSQFPQAQRNLGFMT